MNHCTVHTIVVLLSCCPHIINHDDYNIIIHVHVYNKRALMAIPYSLKFSRDLIFIFAVFAVDWQTTKIKSAK